MVLLQDADKSPNVWKYKELSGRAGLREVTVWLNVSAAKVSAETFTVWLND